MPACPGQCACVSVCAISVVLPVSLLQGVCTGVSVHFEYVPESIQGYDLGLPLPGIVPALPQGTHLGREGQTCCLREETDLTP